MSKGMRCVKLPWTPGDHLVKDAPFSVVFGRVMPARQEIWLWVQPGGAQHDGTLRVVADEEPMYSEEENVRLEHLCTMNGEGTGVSGLAYAMHVFRVHPESAD